MTGGGDDDRFVFRFGRDVITDFRPGDDDDDDDDDDGGSGGGGDGGGGCEMPAAWVAWVATTMTMATSSTCVTCLGSTPSAISVMSPENNGDDVVLRFSDDNQFRDPGAFGSANSSATISFS